MQAGFPSVMEADKSIEITPFPMTLFNINMESEGYFTYQGSLTTPPCSEVVTWILVSEIKNVGSDQVMYFFKLLSQNVYKMLITIH